MIVIDASVVLHAILDGRKDRQFMERLEQHDELIAPELIMLEVTNGIRRQLRLNQLTLERAADAVEDLQTYPILCKPIYKLVSRIWQFRNNFTPYDAAYVALAEDYGISFLTRDQKLAAAIKAHTKVELI